MVDTPTTTLATDASGMLLTISPTSVSHSPVSTVTFMIFSTWDVRISMPSPARNPTSTDLEMKRTIEPALTSQSTMSTTPVSIATPSASSSGIAPVSAAIAGSTPTRSAAMVASGPMTSWREPEKSANAIAGMIAALMPTIAGRPAASAIADVERQRERSQRDAGEDLGEQARTASWQQHAGRSGHATWPRGGVLCSVHEDRSRASVGDQGVGPPGGGLERR